MSADKQAFATGQYSSALDSVTFTSALAVIESLSDELKTKMSGETRAGLYDLSDVTSSMLDGYDLSTGFADEIL